MILKTIESEGLAHFSYFVGDESAGIAAVIDPRRDIEVYIEAANETKTHITYIFETHVHADFVSGAKELAAKTGAEILAGKEAGFQFDFKKMENGEIIELGELKLKVIHTPGHTPEMINLLISGGTGSEKPWGLFSGDTIFSGEIGRPDLLGEGTEKKLASMLYHTLHNKILNLGDEIIIYPGHGKGSPCGAAIGDRSTTTIGYEKSNNPDLQIYNEEKFINKILASLSPAPKYYPRMKKINAEGPEILGSLPYIKPIAIKDFKELIKKENTIVVDARGIEAFGGAHIPGSINISLRSAFPIWTGWILDETFPVWAGRMLDENSNILLVLPDHSTIETISRHLVRLGYKNIGGYLQTGIKGWIESGEEFKSLNLLSVHDLKNMIDREEDFQLIDVRREDEWKEEHIPGSENIYVPFLRKELERFDKEKKIVTYCGSGYRASIAASIFRRSGFEKIHNVPGSMSAWLAAGYKTETRN